MATSKPPFKTRLKMHVLTTLLGWAAAFVIVYIMLFFFGEELESLPIALNALIFTGILVTIMGNFVMPHIGAAVSRYVEKDKV